MSRKKGLSPDEIAELMRQLSENESDCGEFEMDSDDGSLYNESSDTDNIQESSDTDNDEESQIQAKSSISTKSTEQYTAKDGTVWIKHNAGNTPGRLSQLNVLKEKNGPSAYATRNIDDSVLSSWLLIIDKFILDHVRECTEIEAQRVTHDIEWKIPREELLAYLSILYARGVTGAKSLELYSLWSDKWGFSFCKETMSRNRFSEISRFLRFDVKSTRSSRLKLDKFAMISEIWNRFIENSMKCFIPGQNITVDEQLFPSKTRCPFTQFIASKPDKYGQKFWIAVDLDTKYVLNAFPYLGKNEERPQNQRLSEYVVLKLTEPFLNKGRNITVDNFFTSIVLAKELKKKKTSLVGTVNKARREIPECIKSSKDNLYSTKILKHEDTSSTLTVYQGKKKKNVLILSSMHPYIEIYDNEKKTPETVEFYNKTKFGVDVFDQMAKKYSVKAGSRRWPVHTFYNMLDIAAINAWILYKEVSGKKISRKNYIQNLAEEMRAEYLNEREKNKKRKGEVMSSSTVSNKRMKCEIKHCKQNDLKLSIV